jgi:hypothetical protein
MIPDWERGYAYEKRVAHLDLWMTRYSGLLLGERKDPNWALMKNLKQ